MPRTPIDPSSWFAVVADPDGNEIGLVEGTTGAGADPAEDADGGIGLA